MPTTRPRYTFTDTGELRKMLDLAERMWPDVADRKELLYRLARTGEGVLRKRHVESQRQQRRERQQSALQRAGDLVEVDALLSDSAWR